MAEFYSAAAGQSPPLPWTNLSPPHTGKPGLYRHRRNRSACARGAMVQLSGETSPASDEGFTPTDDAGQRARPGAASEGAGFPRFGWPNTITSPAARFAYCRLHLPSVAGGTTPIRVGAGGIDGLPNHSPIGDCRAGRHIGNAVFPAAESTLHWAVFAGSTGVNRAAGACGGLRGPDSSEHFLVQRGRPASSSARRRRTQAIHAWRSARPC